MRSIFKYNKWIRVCAVLAFAAMAVITVWAMRRQLFAGRPQPGGGDTGKWQVIQTDPWQELDKLVTRLEQSIPYTQTGKLLLDDEKGVTVEEKDFSIAYYDTSTAVYRLADFEMIQTAGWQATIDHDRQLVVVYAAGRQTPAPLQLDISTLKQSFNDNNFDWKVMQGESGKRMLVSDNYINGAITGLQIHYDANTMTIFRVNMGLPKMVDVIRTEGKDTVPVKDVVSENIRIEYGPIEPVDNTGGMDPRNCFTISHKKLVALDKRFENYRIINSIK